MSLIEKLTATLKGLVDRGFLVPQGVGRGTIYYLPGGGIAKGEPVGPDDTFEDEGAIQQTLDTIQQSPPLLHVETSAKRLPRAEIDRIILRHCETEYRTAQQIAEGLSRSVETVRVHYLPPLLRDAKLELKYPEQPKHPDQGYKTRVSRS